MQTEVPVIGVFFSHWGLKNWLLHLYPGYIEAEPLGVIPSIKAGGYAGMSDSPAMNNVYAASSNPTSSNRRRESELFHVQDLQKIVVRRQLFAANEVRIYWHSGKKLVMGLGFRPATDQVRKSLRAAYPAIYHEHRFKA